MREIELSQQVNEVKPTFRLVRCNLLILLVAFFQSRILCIYNYLFLLIIFETSEMWGKEDVEQFYPKADRTGRKISR